MPQGIAGVLKVGEGGAIDVPQGIAGVLRAGGAISVPHGILGVLRAGEGGGYQCVPSKALQGC